MVRNKTPRLKLTSESDDEYIDQFEYNWPILDLYADSLSVADGYTPPDTQLFPGCFVSEKTSGKMWMCKQDINTGAFTKSWVVYPWNMEAQGVFGMTGADQNPRYFTDGVVGGSGSNPADLDSNKAIVIPIHGIYAAWYRMSADNVNDSSRVLWTGLNIDGGFHGEMLEQFNSGQDVQTFWSGNFELNAGSKICYWAGEFGPNSPCTCKTRVGLTLITPLD